MRIHNDIKVRLIRSPATSQEKVLEKHNKEEVRNGKGERPGWSVRRVITDSIDEAVGDRKRRRPSIPQAKTELASHAKAVQRKLRPGER